MEIILVKDVKRLGQAGEIKRVTDGYARNYLIPRGLAVPATGAARRQAAERAVVNARRDTSQMAKAEAQAVDLGDVELVFKAKASESGRLYGSITSAGIAAQLSDRIGREVNKRAVLLDDPIKEVGTSEVDVRLHSDVTITVTVVVKAEEA